MPGAFVGTTSKTNTSTTALAPAWSGDQPRTAGNVLFAVVTSQNASSVTCTCTTPAGWTLDVSQTGASTTPRMGIWIFRKVATGGDAAPSFTLAAGQSTVYLYEVSGLDTTGAVLDAAAAGAATTSPTTGSTAAPSSASAGWALCAAGGRASAAGVAAWTGATAVDAGVGASANIFLNTAAVDLGSAGAQSFKETQTNGTLYAAVAAVYFESGAPAAVPDRWGPVASI